MVIGLWLFSAFLAGVVVFLAIAFVSIHRRHRPRFKLPEGAHVRHDLGSLTGLTHGTIARGNRVEVIENGDGYVGAALELIDEARSSVHFETFLWKSGRMSGRIVDALARAARRGCEVRVLVDGIGGKICRSERKLLRRSGAHLCVLRPFGLQNLGWVGSSRVDLQACKLEYSIVSPK